MRPECARVGLETYRGIYGTFIFLTTQNSPKSDSRQTPLGPHFSRSRQFCAPFFLTWSSRTGRNCFVAPKDYLKTCKQPPKRKRNHWRGFFPPKIGSEGSKKGPKPCPTKFSRARFWPFSDTFSAKTPRQPPQMRPKCFQYIILHRQCALSARE